MNKRCFYQFICAVYVLAILGCGGSHHYETESEYLKRNTPTYTWKSSPSIQVLTKKEYDIKISPYGCETSYFFHDNGCRGIDLIITNKTDKDINLIWDQTLFVDNGQTNGTFMFEGIVYSRRNEKKSNDIIFANSTFQKAIFPNNRADLTRVRGWRNTAMRDGSWGVYLTLQVDGQLVHEKLTYSIYRE